MIQLTFIQILTSSLIIAFCLGLVQWLLTKWVSARLEKSIQHEYDRKLEEYKFQQLQRQKAETIARLFARWIKYRGNESTYLNKSELINFYEELNQMSIEISLWIKDKKLLTDIMARLQMKADAKDIRTLSGEIRKLILDIDDKFDPLEIVLWPNPEIEKTLFNNIPKSIKKVK
ncbi:MAG: hypothetical protein WCW87_02900 [Candidatus Paceibacterota bacterium]